MNLPFAILNALPGEQPIVLLGLTDDGLVGFDPIHGEAWSFEPDAIIAVVDPPNVFYGIEAQFSVAEARMVANRRKRLIRMPPRGSRFPVLPPGEMSGFPVAEKVLRKHRADLPSVDAITVSALFAISTVRTSIREAELSYACFGKLYNARSRTMPPVEELRGCFRGLQNTKSAMFKGVAAYAPTIREAMRIGYRDAELRSVLALDSELPAGLGLAKLSFTLALLGQDCVCLDARLLGTMFTKARRAEFEAAIGKEGGRIPASALLLYQSAENAFISGNRYYDENDPIGRARAQWLSWEAVGGKGAAHESWIEMVP